MHVETLPAEDLAALARALIRWGKTADSLDYDDVQRAEAEVKMHRANLARAQGPQPEAPS